MKKYVKITIPVLLLLAIIAIISLIMVNKSKQITNSIYNLKEQTSANASGDATRNVEVEKRWKVPEDVAQDYQVTVRLIAVVGENRKNATYADGTEVPTQTIRGNLGTTIFENVPVYEDGTKIKYEAEEIKVEKSLGINPQTGEEDFETIPLEKFKVAYEFYEKQIPEETPQVEPPEIGEEVTYATSINDEEYVCNWKVFYVDGDYTYLILEDYLPNRLISEDIKDTYGLYTDYTYSVYTGDGGENFVEAMTKKENWKSLLKGTLNGHEINYTESQDTNIFAMASPTLELWVNSWNETYPDDKLYIMYSTEVEDWSWDYDGWFVSTSPDFNPGYADLRNTEGYNNTLYFPHKQAENVDNGNCYGYWLASISENGEEEIMDVHSVGNVGNLSMWFTSQAFRPVICLPTSEVY